MTKDKKPRKPRARKGVDPTETRYDNEAADGLYEAHVDSVWDESVLEDSGELYHLVGVALSSRTDDGAEVGLYREYKVRRASDVRELRCLAAQVDLPLNSERDIPELVKRLWYEKFMVLLSTDDNGRRIVHFIDKAPGSRQVPDARDADNIWDHAFHRRLRQEEAYVLTMKESGLSCMPLQLLS